MNGDFCRGASEVASCHCDEVLGKLVHFLNRKGGPWAGAVGGGCAGRMSSGELL
jgi:hypothetical protein